MWHRQVPAPARDKLARRLAACARGQEDTEAFLASVLACVGDLPPETTQALLRFRVDPSAPGMLFIQGMPLDVHIPPTPTAPAPAGVKATPVSEAGVLLAALLLGEPVAYAEEKNGVLVQDVYPIEAERRSPSNESSDQELGFHTELAFSRRAPRRPLHLACPDFLLLLGLRAAPGRDAVTTVVEGRDIVGRLSPSAIATLRQALFELRAPYSFTRDDVGDRPWSPPVPLLHSTEGAITMAFDLACGVRGTTADAAGALDELRRVVATPDVHRHVRLGPGDLLVIDNRKCAHARSRFEAKFDGTDRWLQRAYVRRSLDGLERASPASVRVL